MRPPPCGTANAVAEGGGQQGVGFWGTFSQAFQTQPNPAERDSDDLSNIYAKT